ncbi:MAG: FeoB-associated Cys-rich membrane protein [Clostridium sp.]
MIIKIILILLIVSYAGYVIYKKVKDIKKGKFCSCGCENCPSKNKCK